MDTTRRAFPLFAIAIGLLTLTGAVSAETTFDTDETKLWIKSDSGPKWGNTMKLGDDQLTFVDDQLTIDLSETEGTGFKMAALTLALTSPTLEAGQAYKISFEVKAEAGGGAVLLMPEDSGEVNNKGDAKPKSKWFRAGGDWPSVEETFVYDPEISDGQIKLFFNPKSAGRAYLIRSFTIEPVSGEPD